MLFVWAGFRILALAGGGKLGWEYVDIFDM